MIPDKYEGRVKFDIELVLTIDFPEKDLPVKARAGQDVTAGVELPRVHL